MEVDKSTYIGNQDKEDVPIPVDVPIPTDIPFPVDVPIPIDISIPVDDPIPVDDSIAVDVQTPFTIYNDENSINIPSTSKETRTPNTNLRRTYSRQNRYQY